MGSFKPNAWGLYDMLGNAQEYSLDYSAEEFAKKQHPKVVGWKGGHWQTESASCTCDGQGTHGSNATYGFLGFRVVVGM